MKDDAKTKQQLIREIAILRQQVTALETTQVENQRIEEALKASEAKYRELVEHANSIILRLDTQGHVTFFNEFARHFFDYTQDEILGRDAVGTIVPEKETSGRDLREMIKDFGQHPERHTSNVNENMRRNGERVWVAWTNKAILDSEGHVTEILCIGNDITERVRTEEALKKSEREYRNLVDNALVGIYKSTLKGDILFGNEAIAKIFGYETPEEFISAGAVARYENSEDRTAFIKKLKQTGRIESIELELVTKTGATRQVLVSAVLDGNVLEGMVMDITEHKRAKEALYQSEGRLQAFANALPDLAFILDEDGRHVEVLTGRKSLLRVPSDQMKDRLLHDVLPKKEADELLAMVRHTIDTGQPQILEYALDVPAGRRWFEGRTSPLREISNKDRMVVLVSRDMTEHKLAEEALQEGEELFRHVVTSISAHIYVTEVTEDGQRLNRYLSPNIESLTGYPHEKFITDWSFWPSAVIHPEDRAAAAEQAERLVKGQDSKMEYRLVRVDDEVIWVRDSGRTKIQGTSRMIYGVVSDITESKWAQEEIVRLYTAERDRYQETEALRQAVLAVASTIDLDQVIERILEELQNVVPYDSASVQLIQEDQLKIIGGRGFPNLPELIGRSLPIAEHDRTGQVLKSSEPVIVDDVHKHDPTYTPMFDLEEDHYSWLGVPLRISERTIGILTVNKQQSSFYTEAHSRQAVAFATQAAVTIENARLHAETQRRVQQLAVMHELDRAISASLHIDDVYQAFSQYTELLLSYDRMSIVLLEEDKLHITYVAGIAEPRVGTKLPSKGSTSERVITRRKPLLIRDVTADMYSASEADWAAGAKSVMVLPLQAKGQAIGTWNISSRHVGFYDVDDLHIAQMIADQLAVGIENARLYEQAQQEIVERKQAETALEEERASLAQRVEARTAELSVANAELARAARLKDEFLANMSHELRTPLNAILGMSEVLRNEVYGPLTTEQMGALGHIEEGGRHLLELINDILDLSKIEADKFELNIGPVWVNDICQASLLFIKQMAQKKQIKVISSFDNMVETLQVDQRRLKQILVNLLSNAVKFTPDEGQVGLEVEGDATRQAVHFTVWDTGIGIAPEAMHELFKPFVQIDSSLSRHYEGTGLGLSLVRRLAEMHGGGVSVESEVDRGSRFTVSLPWQMADASTQSAEDRTQNAEPETESSPTNVQVSSIVLLVEDNETNIITVRDFLQKNGYQVNVAHNGVEAIEQAKAMQPDIILMDIQMPVMDGLEATRRLRADAIPGMATIPIIALTSLAMPGDRERCLRAGANEYLNKPVSLARLVKEIEAQLVRVNQKNSEETSR